jgi:hypothetical protein
VLAVRHLGYADVTTGEEFLKFPNVACGNIRVLKPLKDENRPAGIKRPSSEQMFPPLLDQLSCDRIGLAVLGGLQI